MTTERQDATTATAAAVNSRARTGRTNGHRRSSERTAERRTAPVRSSGDVERLVVTITRERTVRH
ncbi:hypothetical protein [Streptomyces sp. CB02959]|uniref:hypothetical protein n=1 Tax=Streptomyces sp. CB02959 TaxID=2020330 RepID=UPI0015E1071E|nr:hypothetical protein [Streptomyces sp. CB02959]